MCPHDVLYSVWVYCVLIAPLKKTNHRQRFALAAEALRIIAKYPKSPDEADPRVSPQISNPKYNAQLKEVGKLAGMAGDWITEKQSGREKTREVRSKYEL
ncbi:MAG: hypothetical protein NC453_13695, partial [Muribaculum sp.]|nr:hypothetical protein [Muribaculum sp.]